MQIRDKTVGRVNIEILAKDLRHDILRSLWASFTVSSGPWLLSRRYPLRWCFQGWLGIDGVLMELVILSRRSNNNIGWKDLCLLPVTAEDSLAGNSILIR